MCGFAGEFLLAPGQADLQAVRAMAGRLTHRGPDEAGDFLCPTGRCAMGFRRLSIIDPPGSHQPMTSPDGRLTVAFNGEIYNFAELRDQLRADGAAFGTRGDTEVLLHLYRRDGADMLEQLVGMFALALYDREEGTLLLARDRLGQKPLWYAPLPGKVLFASEAKALLAGEAVSRELDNKSIYRYMSIGYCPAPRSAWRGLRKIPPGHCMLLSGQVPRARAYWEPPRTPIDLPADPVRAVREALKQATRLRMISDVPLGALLSGGIDSAIVVALMCRAAGQAGGVRTFTAGFEDPEFDERQAAAEVASHCGTDHTELLIRPDPAGMLERIVDLYDEPFADSSALPTWLICREARKHVTVALGGDGGDEVFGGYDRYRAMRLAETMGPLKYTAVRMAALLARAFAPVHERSRLRRLIRFADGLSHPPAMQYLRYRGLFAPKDLVRLLTPAFLPDEQAENAGKWFCDLYEEPEFDDEVAYAQRHDLLSYLPDDLLVKTDIASMACSLELRAPMLDHRVVSLGLSLPAAMKVDARRGKLILRQAFSDLLPAGVWHRKKRGFGVPLGRWLRHELRDTVLQTLTDPALERAGIFREDALAGLANDHLSGKDDHSHRLWAVLVFARWLVRQG